MTEEIFDGQIAASLQRLEMLWQRTNALPKSLKKNWQQIEEISNQNEELLLRESLEELTCSLHELQVASEEVRQQNEELIATRLEVEAERQRYQEMFEFAPDAYLVTNPEGVIWEANFLAGKLLNVNCDRLIGKPLVVFVSESARRDFRTQLFRLQKGQECRDWEVQIQPRKGELFPAACTVVPVLNSSRQVVSLRWQLRDITKHKQAETEINKALAKQKELNDMKASFVSAISQEFRTPLTNIIASAELIKIYADRWSNEKKNQHLECIQSAVKQTNQLLNDILLVSGTEGDKLQFKPALLDLEKFCRELAEEMQSGAGKQNTIIFSVQGKGTSACLDGKLLSSILTNLISNALKYSPQGGNIQFDLICEHSEAIFRVKDEGIGIPLEDRSKLFDSFQRGSNVGHIDGIGLGLSVVKQCVDFHGGKIAVESEVGVGTTVTVTLPLYHRQSQNEQKSDD
ncbi:PAS domain-containing sensor histidine kinase [Argonema galeatum]|uniref:PAS domain-containing sensor histidine kinase n=1 Tax=Argonema galeatum TaxID=2942762 RepID=UPI002012C37A|nr:ATP-binding protein [Argonema galeatum]MCL1465061.1 PAS domain S-box protein [Argonema galeatum A003/A1]